MFLKTEQIRESLGSLKSLHPFYGITFLACKKERLPVGEAIQFPINAVEKDFLDQYFKPDEDSKFYYQVFQTSNPSKRWLSPKYPSSGSQSTRTRGKFANAFIHPTTTEWGWRDDYIKVLQDNLIQTGKDSIPAFHMAVWFFRNKKWSSEVTESDVINFFVDEFLINENEKGTLFNTSIPTENLLENIFQEEEVSWRELRSIIGAPPDSMPEEGGTLRLLEIQGVGPAKKLSFEPGERLTLITGDNGLGKTFLLDCAWWALTGKWAGLQAYPIANAQRKTPMIKFQMSGDSDSEPIQVSYDWKTQSWKLPRKRPTIPGLLVYAKVDGSFAVWDPAKTDLTSQELNENSSTLRPYAFTRDEVWNGQIGSRKNPLINGLIYDWILWQTRPETFPFNTLKKVLRRLSPPTQSDLGILSPGEPVRIPYDPRLIPTIKHAYGSVPIVYTSAGVRRVITLAYLIVWAWEEHKIQSQLAQKEPQRRMVILVDELEAHLHPQWQRVILPALLDVRKDLENNLQVQLIIATHSPLVMASVETKYDINVDKLFHLDLPNESLLNVDSDVELKEMPFIRRGRIDAWLTSDVFGLGLASGIPREESIKEAKRLQSQENPNPEEIERVSEKLKQSLAEDDNFWPRWVFFAEQHGVQL